MLICCTNFQNPCGLNKFFIIFNLLICMALSIISILPKVQEYSPTSGLLQGSAVCVYIMYLTWSAMNNSESKFVKMNTMCAYYYIIIIMMQ